MRDTRKWISLVLAGFLLLGAVPGLAETDDFSAGLEARYVTPDRAFATEVRWWMAEGAHTDETLLEEIQAIHDAGFRGMELCEQVDPAVSETEYGYGSVQWDHDLKLVLNKALDLGMTVSLTSGTNWATANIPGLDPQSQAASQMVFSVEEYLKAGKVKDGPVPMKKKQGTKTVPVLETARLVGVFAYRQTTGNKASPIRFDPAFVELTDQVVRAEDGTLTLAFTPPDPESAWRIFYYWQQGAEQTSSPAAEPAYTINYFDEAGVEALRTYWEAHILDDPALNAKIAAGDVQVFMDSLEIHPGSGFTFWSRDMEQEFLARKGYDIRPYLCLFIDLPDLTFWGNDGFGAYRMEGEEADSLRIMNDLFDVQTQLYMERMLTPLKAWLNSIGITTRAQISYGQRLEISEPIQAVDWPEAENLNQNNQVDIYRLWTGGAKLQNKALSSETGAVGGCNYFYQDHLMEAYDLFSAGFSRIIWHVWEAVYGPGEASWPGYRVPGAVFRSFYPFSSREPSARDYPLFNAHLGRAAQLLREGRSRTDIGMLYMNYQQTTPSNGNHGGVNWMLNHEPVLFPSTALQDAGYTYDYFSPDFLTAEGVSFDSERKTLEQAGYKALVVWQENLTLDGAHALLSLAGQGMPVILLDGAAAGSPYASDDAAALAETVTALRMLPNVREAADAEAVLPALQSLGIEPYAGFTAPNHQLLTQSREEEGVRFLYVHNYCDGSYMGTGSDGGKQDDHGASITTEMAVDGTFVPYEINAWSGRVSRLGSYRHENGRTLFPITLDYNNIALYAMKPCEAESEPHTETRTALEGRDITGWQAEVERWTAGEEKDIREETLFGQTVTESAVRTTRTVVSVSLDTLVGWDQMPGVGPDAVGRAHYTACFDWDGSADGAYIDFGKVLESMRVTLNGQNVEGVSMTSGLVDITPWLISGENRVEIDYSSNLSNAIGSGVPAGWTGYHTGRQSYGPQQAVLIPYITEQHP